MIQAIDQLIGGSTDTSGNFSSAQLRPVPTLWGALKVVAQTSGPAQWVISVGGAPKAFGRGPRIDIPILVQPAQGVQVQISGALAGADVAGDITGVGGSTLDEVAPYISLVPNTIALDTYGGLQALKIKASDSGIYATPANTVLTNVVYVLPAGTLSVRYEINQLNANTKWAANTIVGNITGRQYNIGTTNPGGTGGFDETFQVEPEDTALLFSIDTTGAANPVSYWFTGSVLPTFVQARLVGPGTNGVPIDVKADTSPAPWQAPTKRPVEIRTAMANGATVVLVAAVAGQIVYCHNFHLISDAAVGAIEWQDTGAAAFGATRLAPAGDNTTGTFGGAPLGTGLGVQINNFSGAAINLWGHFTYSQQ